MYALPKDDDKPMIEIMDQLSPGILDSFVNAAVSDTVSCLYLQFVAPLQSKPRDVSVYLLRVSFS